MRDLNTNSDIFVINPDPSKESSFSSWENEFSADYYTDEIASLLGRYPELRSKMDSLVPETVSYKDFWMRYFFQKSKIDAEEAMRRQLLETNDDENNFDWDGDDETDDVELNDKDTFPKDDSHQEKTSTEIVEHKMSTTHRQSEPAPRNSSTSESSTSFDVVSQSSAIPPLTTDKVVHNLSYVNPRFLRPQKTVTMIGNN